MLESLKRAILAGLVLLGMSSCGDDSMVVWLHLNNVTPDVVALQVVVTLDGKAAIQQYEFTKGLGEVAVKLRKSQLGQGQLIVNLFGMNGDRCKVSTGKYGAKVSADKPYEEVYVALGMVLPAKCPLTVETDGQGIVTSSPAGLNCGANCTMEVPVGTKVTLTAVVVTPFLGSFWEGCSRVNDTCEVTVTKNQKVSVLWEPEVRPKLVKVPNGGFTMGSPTGEFGRNSDETQHSVTLTRDFWMAESEVTQRQYRNLMGSSPSIFKGDELPVEQVSWFDAVAYCNVLSAKEKLTPCYQISGTTVGWAEGLNCTGYRLPTEAEWEYAARLPASKVYAGSDSVDGVAWYSANSGSTTHAVKTKTANDRGLYDLSGNVWEWVWDWYQSDYESLTSTDPIGAVTSAARVFRGGAWNYTANNARAAHRSGNAPALRYEYLGFRIVRSISYNG